MGVCGVTVNLGQYKERILPQELAGYITSSVPTHILNYVLVPHQLNSSKSTSYPSNMVCPAELSLYSTSAVRTHCGKIIE